MIRLIFAGIFVILFLLLSYPIFFIEWMIGKFNKKAKDAIVNNFDALCTEMEGAAIAHGAFLNKIPFVVIRAISDKADNSAEMDYPTFEREAAIHCANLIEHMLPNIA